MPLAGPAGLPRPRRDLPVHRGVDHRGQARAPHGPASAQRPHPHRDRRGRRHVLRRALGGGRLRHHRDPLPAHDGGRHPHAAGAGVHRHRSSPTSSPSASASPCRRRIARSLCTATSPDVSCACPAASTSRCTSRSTEYERWKLVSFDRLPAAHDPSGRAGPHHRVPAVPRVALALVLRGPYRTGHDNGDRAGRQPPLATTDPSRVGRSHASACDRPTCVMPLTRFMRSAESASTRAPVSSPNRTNTRAPRPDRFGEKPTAPGRDSSSDRAHLAGCSSDRARGSAESSVPQGTEGRRCRGDGLRASSEGFAGPERSGGPANRSAVERRTVAPSPAPGPPNWSWSRHRRPVRATGSWAPSAARPARTNGAAPRTVARSANRTEHGGKSARVRVSTLPPVAYIRPDVPPIAHASQAAGGPATRRRTS